MVPLVVVAAQADQVRGLGRAAVGPVQDVVDLDVALTAARDAAALVAMLDDAARPVGNRALAASDTERNAVAFPHRPEVGIAQQVVAERHWQGNTVRELHGGGVEMDMDGRKESLTPLDGDRASDRRATSASVSLHVTSTCPAPNRPWRASFMAASTSRPCSVSSAPGVSNWPCSSHVIEIDRCAVRLGDDLVGVVFEVLVTDHPTELAHGGDGRELGHVDGRPMRELGGDFVGLVDRELAACGNVANQHRELVDPSAMVAICLARPGGESDVDRQPVGDRVDPFTEPAAVALGVGGDIDETSVLDVEHSGNVGELILQLELSRRRRHDCIVHTFDRW